MIIRLRKILLRYAHLDMSHLPTSVFVQTLPPILNLTQGVLKSREEGWGGGGEVGWCKRGGNVSRKNRVNSDKSQKKSNLGEIYALNDHRQPAHESCSNINSGGEAATECLALLSFHLSSSAFIIPLSTVLNSDTWCGVLGTSYVSCDLRSSSDYVVFMPCAWCLL